MDYSISNNHKESSEGRSGCFQGRETRADGQPGPRWVWGLLSAGWRTQPVDAAAGTMGLKRVCPRAHCCPPVWTPISRVIPVFSCSFLVFLTVSSLSGLGHALLSFLCCAGKEFLCLREGGSSSSPLQDLHFYKPGASHFSIYSYDPNLCQESNPIKHHLRGLLWGYLDYASELLQRAPAPPLLLGFLFLMSMKDIPGRIHLKLSW